MPDTIPDLQHLTDREILIITAKTVNGISQVIPKHEERIKSLEDDRLKLKTVGLLGGSAGFLGFLTSAWQYIKHWGQ
jgi:hypothetical protein